MKKVLASLILVGLLAVPAITSAGIIDDLFRGGRGGGAPDAPRWGEYDVFDTLDALFNYLFGILMIIAAIFIVVAAYNFVTASGDPEKTKKARDFVMYALIGVLVAVLAKALIYLVQAIAT